MTEKQPRKIEDQDLDQVQGGWQLVNARITSVKDDRPDLRQEGFTPPLGSDKGS